MLRIKEIGWGHYFWWSFTTWFADRITHFFVEIASFRIISWNRNFQSEILFNDWLLFWRKIPFRSLWIWCSKKRIFSFPSFLLETSKNLWHLLDLLINIKPIKKLSLFMSNRSVFMSFKLLKRCLRKYLSRCVIALII